MFPNKSAVESNTWISCPNPNPQAPLRLFCFPYAGTGATAFFPWSKLLPPQIEFCLIHLPGREKRLRETPYTRLTPLVEALTDAFHSYLDKPFTFFGHSMGALVCFELARQLRRDYAVQPVHLFVSGRRAPQLPDPNPPLHPLPDSAFLQEIQRRYNGLPEIILQDPELKQLFLPILRADLTVIETYVHQPEIPLDCPISVFGGRQDKLATEEDLAAWRDQTQGPFSLRMFTGNHFFIQPAQKFLVQDLLDDLLSRSGRSTAFIPHNSRGTQMGSTQN